jgi:hypothetical protein
MASHAPELFAWGGDKIPKKHPDSAKRSARPPDQKGIREDIPADDRQRYQNWKDELMSTEFGREQWNAYASRKDFLLTITVA